MPFVDDRDHGRRAGRLSRVGRWFVVGLGGVLVLLVGLIVILAPVSTDEGEPPCGDRLAIVVAFGSPTAASGEPTDAEWCREEARSEVLGGVVFALLGTLLVAWARVHLDEQTDEPIVEPAEPNPPVPAVQAAVADLRRIIETTRLITVGCMGLVLVGFPLARAVPLFTLLAWFVGVIFGPLYGIAWRRARIARRLIDAGSPLAVWAIGWERPPDGQNYAIFLDATADDPDFVIRLPLRRDLERSTTAWVYGPLKPNLLGGVALVGSSGLLATGRVVGQRSARAKWRRRGTEPNMWVPENWLPPGGN